MIVALFAAVGADPYLQLLLWVNGPGIIGIIALQALAAAAVVGFFWKDRRGESVLRAWIAPAVATILLAGAALLVIVNIDLLTAGGRTVNTIIIAIVPIVFGFGVGLAQWMRRRSPERYAALATTDPDAPLS